ncbi:MAG TPA: hypothetical protein VK487_08665 [Candidatus Bathyarchaeia archaeon]|jgi:hypothetical protein|nr:hypothetical protein [Candidatus Bathyarchaeia archaeon]
MKCKPQNLLDIYKEIRPFLIELGNLKLEEVNFDQVIRLGDSESMTLRPVFHFVFDTLSNIRGFGPVPASKTLHLVAPSLFVMWDRPICKELYDLRLNGYCYAYKFIPKMKEELEEAIESCMQERACSRTDAVKWLYEEIERIHHTRRTLAKAIDECNWIIAHP